MSHHTLEVKDLVYSYPDGTRGVAGVSFRLTHGEAVALVGENGAGKSTLLKHLNGVLFASSGEVRVGGDLVTPRNLPMIRRTVGMVFQDPDDQLFMPTVAEDVAFGPRNMGLTVADVEQRVADALETVAVSHLAGRPPYRLSGGEKRAAAIATVLAMAPDILVMDEPSDGLDPKSRRRLIELLRGFAHTKVIATHDLDLALDVCSRVIVLHEGRVVADGTAAEVFNRDELLATAGLERPLSMQACPVCSGRR